MLLFIRSMSYNKQETTSIILELLNSAISSEGVVNVVPEKKVLIVIKCETFAELSTIAYSATEQAGTQLALKRKKVID